MSKWVRICKTVNDKGKLIPLEEAEDYSKLSKYISKDPNSDWYKSVYHYTDEAKKYFDDKGSIKGYRGIVLSNKLVFDLDSEADLTKAKEDAIKLLENLNEEGIDVGQSVLIYFSGGKGFHVEVPIDTYLEPEDLKKVCASICKNIPTFDTSVYNTNRILRLPNTKHEKTSLYKVELDPEDLIDKDIEHIKIMAKQPKKMSFVPKTVKNSKDIIKKYKENKFNQVGSFVYSGSDQDGIRGLDTVNFGNCPPGMPRCLYALTKGVMKPGERQIAFFRLAAYYRNQGMDKEVCYNTLKGIARLNKKLYPDSDPVTKDELYNQAVASVYDKTASWKQIPGKVGTSENNELLEKYCRAITTTTKPCVLHTKLNQEKSVITIDSVSESFQDFAENFDKNRVFTGIDFIDDNMKITTSTTTLLVGSAGSGKSTLALNIMENANKFDQRTMFFSLDMDKNLIYLKLAQKLTGYSQDQILQFYKTKQQTKIEEIRTKIQQTYGKTSFDFTKSAKLEDITNKIRLTEQKTGEKVKLVVVDYAGRLGGPYSGKYDNASYNAIHSSEAADATETAWIILSQISRASGDGSLPLRNARVAKESGDWEESCSNQINIWRPFKGRPDEDIIMRLFMAKNRMGRELERPLWWDGAKGRIWDMTEKEIDKYEEDGGLERENQAAKFKFSKFMK